MSRRAAGALLALAVLVLAIAIWRLGARGGEQRRPEAAAPATAETVPTAPAVRRSATLWLPGPRGRIGARVVDVDSGESLDERLAALLDALLAARAEGELVAVFPVPVAAAAAIVAPDGVLYVDLRAAEGGEPPAAGSTLELQRVYSIVHTVLRNEPDVAGVVLLWNGAQRLSFSGHVDTTRPLGLRPELELR